MIGLITQDGAYHVRRGQQGIEWHSPQDDGGPDVVLHEEPETDFGSRLRLNLLDPFVPEGLL